jgi:predicted nucleic acid-binding Zn ribbon protein
MSRKRKNNPRYRNEEPTSLGDALSQMFDAYHIKAKADKTSIVTLWEELMGKTIASRTQKLFFKADVLYVELSSAPLKQELTLNKEKIMKLIEDKVGKEVISDIVFR